MDLYVDEQLVDFIKTYLEHFGDDVDVSPSNVKISFEKLRQMCRRMRDAGINPVDRWWPFKVVGPKPRLANCGEFNNRSPVEKRQVLVDSEISMVINAFFTLFGATASIYIACSYLNITLLNRLLISLTSFFVIFIAEAYFVVKKLD